MTLRAPRQKQGRGVQLAIALGLHIKWTSSSYGVGRMAPTPSGPGLTSAARISLLILRWLAFPSWLSGSSCAVFDRTPLVFVPPQVAHRATWAEKRPGSAVLHVYPGEDLCGSRRLRCAHARVVGACVVVVARLGGWMDAHRTTRVAPGMGDLEGRGRCVISCCERLRTSGGSLHVQVQAFAG